MEIKFKREEEETWRERNRKESRKEQERWRYEVMSVERRAAGLWLVVRPETEFCHCNLTLCFCNDSPGGTNDFLHWCYYCWSHHEFKRRERYRREEGRAGQEREEVEGGKILKLKLNNDLSHHLSFV